MCVKWGSKNYKPQLKPVMVDFFVIRTDFFFCIVAYLSDTINVF